MRTLSEFLLLTSETLTVWGRTFFTMGAWFSLGFALHALGLLGSATIGGRHMLLSTLCFVGGVIAQMVCTVMMIHSAEPQLRSPAELRVARTPGVPATVFAQQPPLMVLLLCLSPFLAVYSVWGNVEAEIGSLFAINSTQVGIMPEAVQNWSVGFNRWKFYLAVAVAAFVLKQLIGLVQRLWDSVWLAIASLLAEAVWIFTSFFGIGRALALFGNWFTDRAIWVAIETGWSRFAWSLPNWQLPFGRDLPSTVAAGLRWTTGTLIPDAFTHLTGPLVWLALVAIVFGWRDILSSSTMDRRFFSRVGREVQPMARAATKDVSEKYIPLLKSLRMVLRAGPRFLGVFLLLAALVTVAQDALTWAIVQAGGPLDRPQALTWNLVSTFISGLLGTTVLYSLYVAAFDRAIADAADLAWQHRRRRRATSVAAARRAAPTDEEPTTAPA